MILGEREVMGWTGAYVPHWWRVAKSSEKGKRSGCAKEVCSRARLGSWARQVSDRSRKFWKRGGCIYMVNTSEYHQIWMTKTQWGFSWTGRETRKEGWQAVDQLHAARRSPEKKVPLESWLGWEDGTSGRTKGPLNVLWWSSGLAGLPFLLLHEKDDATVNTSSWYCWWKEEKSRWEVRTSHRIRSGQMGVCSSTQAWKYKGE